MGSLNMQAKQRSILVSNFALLFIVNVCFYFVTGNPERSHVFDYVGISAFIGVITTFYYLYIRTGFWKLIHTQSSDLDERELQITHKALAKSYSWFSVICLLIMFVHAVLFRFINDLSFVITVPLVVSLIYLAHTIPASVIAWTECALSDEAE